jgi:hypothetical protein
MKHNPRHDRVFNTAVILLLHAGKQPLRPKAEDCDGVAVSDELWALIKDCWKKNPGNRPDITEVVARLQRHDAD